MKRRIRPTVPRQLALALHPSVLRDLTRRERDQAVNLLAQLLLEAIGVIDEEDGDEDV